MVDLFPLDPYSNWITGSNPYDNPRLNELRALADEQNRINWENYQRQLQTRTAVPVGDPYGPSYPARYKGRPYLPSGPTGPVVNRYLPGGPTSPVVDHPTINDYRNMRAASPQMARTAPVNPRTYPVATVSPKSYPVIESSRYLPTLSKFNWLKLGSRALGPVATAATVYEGAYNLGKLADKSFGVGDYWLGDAGKADLSEFTRSTEIPNQGNLYNGEISDDEFNSMSHADKLKWLADRRHYRENANYVPASPTATNEYGEGKTPTGGVVLGSDAPTDAMLPDGTMVHDGVTVAPTVPTVDTLIATANKPRVANRVANRTPVAPTTPTPTFNYGGSAPSYASSYNLNRDPNYQYSEAYAWRNNPAPAPTSTPWNNGWAKPNPRASSITNYYAGIGY